MLAKLSGFIYSGLDSCFNWFVTIYDSLSISFVGIFFALVIVTSLGRYILRPFIGYAAGNSDTARKLRKKRKNSSGD